MVQAKNEETHSEKTGPHQEADSAKVILVID